METLSLQRNKTAAGLEWCPHSHVFRFVDPFIEVCEQLKQYKHIDIKSFAKKWSLMESEVCDLIGKAEEIVNK